MPTMCPDSSRMRSQRIYHLILACGAIILGCLRCYGPTAPSEETAFAIYLLDDPTITTLQAEEVDLSQLDLQGSPWLCISDMEFYDYSTHCIYLKDDFSSLFGSDSITVFSSVLGVPFVVVANGERCYLGSFWSMLSSLGTRCPTIEDIELWFYPSDVIHINDGDRSPLSAYPDVRDQQCIREGLQSYDKLHEGLRIDLEGVEVINQPDTSTVRYTFRIINEDIDDLYVPDPELMGSALFHYYTNGIVLDNGEHSYRSEYKSVEGPDSFWDWDPGWFVRIESQSSIRRTVTLRGYPPIPEGNYSCWFVYAGPTNIEREARMLSDGRLWLGEVVSDVLEKHVVD
ncbi:MAG: hypothetical protein JSW54_00980 [Fidelibacterota bacterium]|nr:MAG: hypothetical protein JSW54_00980 [Candidatus Neomarinimicrobiota bacterium]